MNKNSVIYLFFYIYIIINFQRYADYKSSNLGRLGHKCC